MTFHPRFWLSLALGLSIALPGLCGPSLENQVGFYGDHEGFEGPFHPAQDLTGAWLRTALAASTGDSTGFEAGLYLEDRDPGSVRTLPWLRFEYHTPTTRLLMGSLESADRHGFLPPLEDPTLSFTRPVEYGLQWLEKDEGFDGDLFLDWQQVDQPGQDEIFDYGGVWSAQLEPWASVVMQFHGHHEGGRIFNLRVVNNYVSALGLRFRGGLGPLGDCGLDLFAVGSSDFEGKFDIGPDWGRGFYARGSLTPGGWATLFGAFWDAQDFFSQEGDPNYNSQGIDPGFYRASRAYAELGLEKALDLGGGTGLDAGVKSCWGDGFQGWVLDLSARAPLHVDLPFQGKTEDRKEGPDAL